MHYTLTHIVTDALHSQSYCDWCITHSQSHRDSCITLSAISWLMHYTLTHIVTDALQWDVTGVYVYTFARTTGKVCVCVTWLVCMCKHQVQCAGAIAIRARKLANISLAYTFIGGLGPLEERATDGLVARSNASILLYRWHTHTYVYVCIWRAYMYTYEERVCVYRDEIHVYIWRAYMYTHEEHIYIHMKSVCVCIEMKNALPMALLPVVMPSFCSIRDSHTHMRVCIYVYIWRACVCINVYIRRTCMCIQI